MLPPDAIATGGNDHERKRQQRRAQPPERDDADSHGQCDLGQCEGPSHPRPRGEDSPPAGRRRYSRPIRTDHFERTDQSGLNRADNQSCDSRQHDNRQGGDGYVANRIYFSMLREAQRVVDAGIASEEDVNQLMTDCFNWPVGPFAMIQGATSGWKQE